MRIRTSGKGLAVLTGAVVVGLGLLGVRQWGPLADSEVVPSCGDLAGGFASTVPGSWTLTRTEPNRESGDYLVRCEFGFRSADQAYAATVIVSLIADDDETALRKKATDAPCHGDAVPNPSASNYRVARSCSEHINDKIFAGTFVASDRRYAHILADYSSSTRPVEQVTTYANTSTQRITDLAMTLEASD